MSDLEGLAARRRRAGKMFERGATQVQVAQELEVSRETARRWYELFYRGGTKTLAAVGQRGRRSRLTDADLGRIDRALRKGAVAHGFDNDLWTTARVAAVIEALTGEHYHPGHVWRLLRQMGWTPQRPARRAVERDEAAVQCWVKHRWPRVKKTPGAEGPGSSSRTSRGSA